MILKNGLKTLKRAFIIQKHGTSYYYLSAGKEIEIRFYLTEHIVRGRKINHVVLDKKISLIGNEVRKTDNWFNEVYNESKL